MSERSALCRRNRERASKFRRDVLAVEICNVIHVRKIFAFALKAPVSAPLRFVNYMTQIKNCLLRHDRFQLLSNFFYVVGPNRQASPWNIEIYPELTSSKISNGK